MRELPQIGHRTSSAAPTGGSTAWFGAMERTPLPIILILVYLYEVMG